MTVFSLVLSYAAQEHWNCESADAASGIPSSRRNRTVALAHDAKATATTRMRAWEERWSGTRGKTDKKYLQEVCFN